MLGAASIGAVFSSCSPDFGALGVLDRFGQIEPVVLFAADSYRYGGKRFDCLERLEEIRAGLPSVRTTVVVRPARIARRRAAGTTGRHRSVGRLPRAAPRPGRAAHPSARLRPPVVRALLVGHHRRRSASSTAPVACCSSTSRNISSTATSAPVTASSTSRPPVG